LKRDVEPAKRNGHRAGTSTPSLDLVTIMAEFIAAFGVSHGPHFPQLVAREGPQSEVARLFAQVRQHLDAARPDVIVHFGNDHFNTFFFDNLPVFAIGVADEAATPNDGTPMPSYKVPLHGALARHIRSHALAEGFDLTLTEDFSLDHAFGVPLHFLAPDMRVPVVPIFINAFVPPLPRAARCHALGRMVRAAIEAFPQSLRVAALCSGAFSLEVGGPRINPGRRDSIPAPDWSAQVHAHLQAGRIDRLVEEATPLQIWNAGNAAGEILNWIAMMGVVGHRKPTMLTLQTGGSHCYGVWTE
jgi:protocatechuate 4,5-dioxygenase beta chain